MPSICSFVKFHEASVWNYLSRVFAYKGLKASEIGVTNDLVFQITDFYRGRPANCEVYIHNAQHESARGADIDLCLFNGSDYDHYMIQAKIMGATGRYLDIQPYAKNEQYCKLIKVARSEDAYPLYLLFNGETQNSISGGLEYGCAIVAAATIKNLRRKQSRQAYAYGNPRITFDQIKRSLHPLHYLFCPGRGKRFRPPIGKKYEQVYKEFPYFRVSEEVTREDNIDREMELQVDARVAAEKRNLAPVRIIINDPDLYIKNIGTSNRRPEDT